MALSDELGRLEELHQQGTLTPDEFARAKARLLEEMATAPPAGGCAPSMSAVNGFRRSATDKWIGGVCGGLARSTGLASWIWRLLFALLFLFGGAGLLIYILLWIFAPIE